jgi:hypothetical protein
MPRAGSRSGVVGRSKSPRTDKPSGPGYRYVNGEGQIPPVRSFAHRRKELTTQLPGGASGPAGFQSPHSSSGACSGPSNAQNAPHLTDQGGA